MTGACISLCPELRAAAVNVKMEKNFQFSHCRCNWLLNRSAVHFCTLQSVAKVSQLVYSLCGSCLACIVQPRTSFGSMKNLPCRFADNRVDLRQTNSQEHSLSELQDLEYTETSAPSSVDHPQPSPQPPPAGELFVGSLQSVEQGGGHRG